MPNESAKQQSGVIGEIVEHAGALFRHLLPGALVLGAGRISHPSWFARFDAASWSFLAVVAVVAFAVGNAWFSVNRYVVHQFIDYLCWRLKLPGPARSNDRHDDKGYRHDLAIYVKESLTNESATERARQHVSFRASSVLLIYTLAELSLLGAFWSEPSSVVFDCKARILLLIGFAVLFAAGIWQNLLTRCIDAVVLHPQK